MRALKDIFKQGHGSNVNRDILCEDGKWCMYDRPPGVGTRNHRVFIIHRCAHSRYAVYMEDERLGVGHKTPWVCGNGDAVGHGGCGEKTPEAMIGMWRLHMWNK